MKWLVHWVLSALAILAVAQFVPGFRVANLVVALIAAVVIGFVNGTVGLVLKVLTFPLTIVTFGLFLLVVNALMLQLVAWFLPGFYIAGFWSAFWGALLLALLNMAIRWLMKEEKERRD
ncbi:MAG: phage holin family protein [Acidobacteriales bacterium]|nr:phage holin family protein [Terriglobales bacterium]